MTDDEFIARELDGLDVSPETIQHRKALEIEEMLHPNESPYARSHRLICEALPAVWATLMDSATGGDTHGERQKAREIIDGFFMTFVERKKEGCS
ncbi:hypothetical protein [Micromonospora sp. NPDC047187]|uniref:hypothetical protein n=1 Tax=Micromonospora sp. NPDC047187 TaxID=3155262 RepID=UPI0033E5D466